MIYKCTECTWSGPNPIHKFCRVCAAIVIEKDNTNNDLEETDLEITTEEESDDSTVYIKPIYYVE